MSADPAADFRRAAIAWAAGGRGQALVDAAAVALAEGLDSPTLRVLAGAPRVTAEMEATDLAPTVFEELGLAVEVRLSPGAIVEGARSRAQEFLSGSSVTPRELTRALYAMFISADHADELAVWSGLDDSYDMLDTKVIAGSYEDVDAAVAKAASALVEGVQETDR